MPVRIDLLSSGVYVAHCEYVLRVDDVYAEHHVVVTAPTERELHTRLATLVEDFETIIGEINDTHPD